METVKNESTFQDDWGFFTQIPDVFIEQSANLNTRARWLFVLLRFYTNKKSKNAFPSYETLQEDTGWSFATIAAAIRDLELGGWLTRQKNFGKNTHYRLVRKTEMDTPLNTEAKAKKHTPPKNRARSSKKQRPVLQEVKTTYMELTQKEFTQTEHEDLNYPKADNSRRESAQLDVLPLFSASHIPDNNSATDKPTPPVHDVRVADSFAAGGAGSGGILPQAGPGCDFDGGGGCATPGPVKTQLRAISAQKPRALRQPKTPKLPADPRASHPAIAAVRDLANRFPDKILWDKIIELLGDSPDISKLKACFMEHVERGFNKNSWKWATEWYQAGIPQNNLKQKKERTYDNGDDLWTGIERRTGVKFAKGPAGGVPKADKPFVGFDIGLSDR